jgi:glutathione S-transferase
MARILYGSWFSTFARKVALALELKQLSFEHVDGLQREFAPELKRVNPRAEVPVLLDQGLVVVNSSDILQYLDWRYPTLALYASGIEERVAARALERLADERLDPIVVDTSFWQWADRTDAPPAGLLARGQADFDATLTRLESELAARPRPWPFGTPGVAECAWFPNLAAARPLGFTIERERYPTVLSWFAAMREHPVFAADRKRVAEYLKSRPRRDWSQAATVYWSGDRIEWLLSRGFHDWFVDEIKAGRATFTEG